MNLPAVLLFICFSTVYGLKCQVGVIATGDLFKIDEVTTEECPSGWGPILCARVESKGYVKGVYGKSVVYFCNHMHLPCPINAPTGLKLVCATRAQTPCVEDGKCDDHFTDTMKTKTCCSTKPEFEDLPSLYDINWGLIIGLPIGILVILAIVAGLLFYFICYRNKKMAAAGTVSRQGGTRSAPRSKQSSAQAAVSKQSSVQAPASKQSSAQAPADGQSSAQTPTGQQSAAQAPTSKQSTVQTPVE